ncbi:MAG: hypothetical protein H6905_00270 [Hyphomicrobiales bacterium]|nr:hypothetical protein [Hyphomicrobiales bacterium]
MIKPTNLIDARDVLDPSARVRCAFTGKIIGCFERTGPNSWDPYTLKMIAGDVITVLAGVKVYVDPSGPFIRLRRQGTVVVVEWVPDDDHVTNQIDPAEVRQIFVNRFLAPFANKPGFGPAAEIAHKLSR